MKMKTIFFFVTVIITITNIQATEYTVASADEFNALCAKLTGGDVVTWTNGTYTDQQIEFYATGGTESNPITLKAETAGKVIFKGTSPVNFSGEYLVMDGFFWKGGEGVSDQVSFRKNGSNSEFGIHCTLKNCAFDNLVTTAPNKSRWVVLHGYDNIVENCSFVNKESTGAAVLVELAYQDTSRTAGHIIRNNYFYNITPKDDYATNTGDCEAIRVGVSTFHANDAGVTVEGNYFHMADGENEIITNKSSNNRYLHNTFRKCRGSLVLRHGSNAWVEGNFFLGEGKAKSGGIRVCDSYHTIINNYMQGLSNDGDSWNNGITIVSGNEATGGSGNGYQYVDDVLIAFNTIYNCDNPIYYNDRYSYVSSGTIAYNLIYSENGDIVSGDVDKTGAGMTYIGNIFGGSNVGITSGYTSGDAEFSAYDEIYKPSATGAAADVAGSTYSSTVTKDIEGLTRPSSNMDVGAFEVAGATGSAVYKPITDSDVSSSVGASFLDATGTVIDGEGVTPIAVTAVSIISAATVKVGNSITLTATVSPSNATTKTVSYASSDESVATVDASGIVTALKQGSDTITVTTDDGGYTAIAIITVIKAPEGLTNVALNKSVTATIAVDTATPEANLIDGSTDTRMSSSGYPQTLIIDLGANYDISYSELVFYEDRAYQYTIETATAEDSAAFTQVVDRSSNSTSGTVSNPLTDYFTTTARYVKFTITGAAVYTGSWVSISEFRVFGVKNSGSTSTKFNIASSNEKLQVYPNPIGNHFTIAVPTSKNTVYKVFDISGRIVMKGVINKTHSKIDATKLHCGVYLVRVNNKTKIIYKPKR